MSFAVWLTREDEMMENADQFVGALLPGTFW